MNDKMKKKNIILSLVIVLVGIILAGGTYAYLTFSMNVTNNVVNGSMSCLDIDYIDNTDQITGTLFPSLGPSKGLKGSIALKINNACDIDELSGSLILNINNVSSKLLSLANFACRNAVTGEIISNSNVFNCDAMGGIFAGGYPLKYNIYNNSEYSGEPLISSTLSSDGFSENENCTLSGEYYQNCQIEIYNNFVINKMTKTLYISIWLDGFFADNSYTDLIFDGYITASFNQQKSYVYTIDAIDEENVEDPSMYYISIGESIPGRIKQYDNPTSVLTGFNDVPLYLKHHLENNIVTETYFVFVITNEMALGDENEMLVAGTYTLETGGDASTNYDQNKNILRSAFGNYCEEENSYDLSCQTDEILIHIDRYGTVEAGNSSYYCTYNDGEGSICFLIQ